MEFQDVEERAHFTDVVIAFLELKPFQELEIKRRENAASNSLSRSAKSTSLLAARQALLNVMDFPRRMELLRMKNNVNYLYLREVVEPYRADFVEPFYREVEARVIEGETPPPSFLHASHGNLMKVKSTLHQLVREWSAEGEEERLTSFGPLLDTVRALYGPNSFPNPGEVRISVPGAGLGRLLIELASYGYTVEGCEFSYQMLLAGDFIMNRARDRATIYPWIDSGANVTSFEDVIRGVTVPDVFPWELFEKRGVLNENESPRLKMMAGEFCEIHAQAVEEYDVVCCSFFLDTASNVSDYLTTIKRMLKVGGRLISFGPLLFHFQPEFGATVDSLSRMDPRFQESIEPSVEDITKLLVQLGFEIERLERGRTTYCNNLKSGMRVEYLCHLIVARKLM